ncbi:MAG TPA: hypothetical protein H9818_10300 [Candidatus Phocaeicola gallistercoris]|nr:hypothetical protein [Candidatus Phocaeicola gallistercoris]
MKNLFWGLLIVTLFMQSCSQDESIDEILDSRIEMNLPKEIEAYGKAVAAEIKTTVTNMVEKGIDYSEIPDTINFRKRFFSDWYSSSPSIVQTRAVKAEYPQDMSVAEFAEKYQMLTDIQKDFIHKIIQECKQSSSDKDLLKRLVALKNEICIHVPDIEQERLLNVISVLFYSIQTISKMEAEGLMLRTPYNYNNLQLTKIKTRSREEGTSVLPSGCRHFLAAVWTIAVGEPTPAGEIVASITTIVLVSGAIVYEVVTCMQDYKENKKYCTEKYVECIDKNHKWNKDNSGGAGKTMCEVCLRYCIQQEVWDCPRPI